MNAQEALHVILGGVIDGGGGKKLESSPVHGSQLGAARAAVPGLSKISSPPQIVLRLYGQGLQDVPINTSADTVLAGFNVKTLGALHPTIQSL